MLEGIFAENVLNHKNIRVPPPAPQETSGYYVGTEAIYKYSLKDTDYPILVISDPIFDNAGGMIKPGYYELALSDSREFLIIIQSKNPVAVIPVIKVEEDAAEPARLNNKKVKRELKKEKKARKETNEKRSKIGMSPDEEKIFMEAEIEYDAKGDYYLIKYQRGTIKAWGAFKG